MSSPSKLGGSDSSPMRRLRSRWVVIAFLLAPRPEAPALGCAAEKHA
jgi:hypothetical protein